MTNETKAQAQVPDTKTAIQRVYLQLRQQIIKGEFAPGERLKVETLKPLFDTGASPIREALSLLTSNKLVDRIDQRGFRVSQVSEANFNEIFMLRCTLDDLALRKSIELGDNDWEERLVLNHHRLSRANQEDFDHWESLHKVFHLCLMEACDSPILLSYCSQLYDQNIRYRFLAEAAVNYAKRDVRNEHESIMNAAINRDADLASKLLLKHYTDTGTFLRQSFAKSSPANWR
ncbi:transcriptional regulator, GntR family protein [Marinomonas sp. MED121]|uniref:GntR family transcriptional regulator n=1 Tax=Marinomonas sp. MED121 TaxID=314277 RepID=UPI0000690EF8|nr:GntR family transcriptional regulator [Marinomonas sp. MED121]EAQ64296.1 transcriptional regulator, GntR family protein [Marinomonas sp. MED121]